MYGTDRHLDRQKHTQIQIQPGTIDVGGRVHTYACTHAAHTKQTGTIIIPIIAGSMSNTT